jgi:hypothetical protein
MSTKHPRTIPALADLGNDISGPLPVGLLDDWAAGERSEAAARQLLAPFRREGIAVSSDTAGLTKMTQERDLLEVLWLVSEPKQILHAVGTAIGGHAVGVWEADNTEMLYPGDLDADVVLDAMLEAQARIAERASVKVGMCLHRGVFYEIGGGLFGRDAQTVELLAESFARGAETLVTNELVESLRAREHYAFERRVDLDRVHRSGAFAVRSARRLPGLREREGEHPHPFPPEFFGMLRQIEVAGVPDASKIATHGAEQRECFVAFVARKGRTNTSQEQLASVLDELLYNEQMATIVAETVNVDEHLAQSGGGLSILVFDRGTEVVDVARLLRERFAAKGLDVVIGVDRGPVLLFAKGKAAGAAGDPINLSSKISEDLGEVGRIRITERAAVAIEGLGGAEPFQAMISGVRVRGSIL